MLTIGYLRRAIMGADPGLVGHWKLQGDGRDYSGLGNHGVNHEVDLDAGAFDGIRTYIETPNADSLKLGTDDFAICAWIFGFIRKSIFDDGGDDVIDMYDPATSRGITLSVSSTGLRGRWRRIRGAKSRKKSAASAKMAPKATG